MGARRGAESRPQISFMSKKGLLPSLPATGGCCCSIGAAAICRPRSPPPSPLMRAIKPRSRKKSVGGFANGQGLSAPANGLTGKPLWSLSCPLCSCTSCSFSFPVHNLQTQLECSQSKRKDIQFEIRCTGVGQNVQHNLPDIPFRLQLLPSLLSSPQQQSGDN